uniref:Uncharacterized protein n=1 Tax=Rhizophora mucronata TaxID=61149 RepID=A0A2P2KEP9_RHIMU
MITRKNNSSEKISSRMRN